VARSAAQVAPVLFEHLLRPLVLGGKVTLMRPLGAELESAIAELPEPVGAEALSQIEFARVRRVRSLTPLDRCAAPNASDWRLLACLHDLLQATHPSLGSHANQKLLANVEARLSLIPPVANVHEALMRHSLFARVLEIARVDTKVSYWVGSATYLGTPVPKRLTAWPELRRVKQDVTRRDAADLLNSEQGLRLLVQLLHKTPLTDFATCTRNAPPFQFTEENAALIAAPVGMKLTLRALHALPSEQVTYALRGAASVNARLQSVATQVLQAFQA
jgi:hypothetical protein